MFLLPRDIRPHRLQIRHADTETSITGLPPEQMSAISHQLGRLCFQRLDQNRGGNLRRQCRQYMYMVVRSTDGIKRGAILRGNSSQVIVEGSTPGRFYEWPPFACGEHKMDVIAGVRMRHESTVSQDDCRGCDGLHRRMFVDPPPTPSSSGSFTMRHTLPRFKSWVEKPIVLSTRGNVSVKEIVLAKFRRVL